MSAHQAYVEVLDRLGIAFKRVVSDSRKIQPGDIFIAYAGLRVDGRQFIPQAISNGAAGVLWDRRGFEWHSGWSVPNAGIDDLSLYAGEIADVVYEHPSDKLWMIGVTGTNGKTSCSHWIAQSLQNLGRKCALLGTLGNGFPGELKATTNTTADAVTLHGNLADYVQDGAQAAAMEVSSHALEQGRVNGIHFDVALLTNLSRDHLDYHGDMQAYAKAKQKLFSWPMLRYAVLNLDDALGQEVAECLRDSQTEVVGYGMKAEALALAERLGVRMVYGNLQEMSAHGLELQLNTSWGSAHLSSPLLGRFNAENLLGTLTVLLVSGVALDQAVIQVAQVKAVSGRMQKMGGNGLPMVVVDYAHTPDALEKVLETLREVTAAQHGSLICVFGCGGDRDRGKRPLMGQVVSRLADVCIVTNDNPRNEVPEQIMADVVSGMKLNNHCVIADRAEAIAAAINQAHVQDTVLLAGKGHEQWQEIGPDRLPFSDAATAQQALIAWRAPA